MTGPVRIERLPTLEAGGRPLLLLPMSAHDRRRARRRLRADDGALFELALPTGTSLPVGLVLHVSETHAYVIAAAPELTLVVRPRDLREAALVGHAIGNLHRDIEVLGDGSVIALHDEPLHNRLQGAGFVVAVEQRPFHARAAGEHRH
jgi:urease accessory protein